MNKIFTAVLVIALITGNVLSQSIPDLTLKNEKQNLFSFDSKINPSMNSDFDNTLQPKKRKTVNSYFGAGYTFMIFTNGYMSNAYPVFDTRNGAFLTNISVFFGFAIAQAVTLEIEPAVLFTNNNKVIDYKLSEPFQGLYDYGHTYTNSMFALPISFNVRFFPMFKLKTFARLFFIGGGVGAAYIREENDVIFNNDPIGGTGYYNYTTMATDQWAPIFKPMIGFTGTGGQFGFGGEIRYNFIKTKQDTKLPFATRFASNFNSVDITLRFYFSL